MLAAVARMDGEVATVREAVRCVDALAGRDPAGAHPGEPSPGDVARALDAARETATRRTADLWAAVDGAVRLTDAQDDPVFRWLTLLVVRHAITADPQAPDTLVRFADAAAVCAVVDQLAAAIERAATQLGADRIGIVKRFQGSLNLLAQTQNELGRLQQDVDRIGIYRVHASSAVERITERLTRPRPLPARWLYAVWRRGRDQRKLGIVNRNLAGASKAFERSRQHQAALHATVEEAETSIQACIAKETVLSAFIRGAATSALLAALDG